MAARALIDEVSQVVGHLPREITRISSFFLDHGGRICGKVTARQQHCASRGGMEIPCELVYEGKKSMIRKLREYYQKKNFACLILVEE